MGILDLGKICGVTLHLYYCRLEQFCAFNVQSLVLQNGSATQWKSTVVEGVPFLARCAKVEGQIVALSSTK